jgi:hypothetical protein
LATDRRHVFFVMGNFLSFVRPRRVLLCIIVGRVVGRVISINIVRTGHRRRARRPALFAAAAVLAVGIAEAPVIVVVSVGITVTTTVAVAAASTVGIVGAVTVALVGRVAIPVTRA